MLKRGDPKAVEYALKRSASMTPERRREVAVAAAKARWAKARMPKPEPPDNIAKDGTFLPKNPLAPPRPVHEIYVKPNTFGPHRTS